AAATVTLQPTTWRRTRPTFVPICSIGWTRAFPSVMGTRDERPGDPSPRAGRRSAGCVGLRALVPGGAAPLPPVLPLHPALPGQDDTRHPAAFCGRADRSD